MKMTELINWTKSKHNLIIKKKHREDVARYLYIPATKIHREYSQLSLKPITAKKLI